MAHPLAEHAHTLATIRLLRSVNGGMRRRGGRIPRQLQPDAIRLEYFAAVRPAIEFATRRFTEVRPEILRLLADYRREQKMDAPGAGGGTGGREHYTKAQARALVQDAADRAVKLWRPNELYDVAAKFGRRTSAHQKEQLNRQAVAAIGVPLSMIEKPARDLVPVFAKANSELLKTVPIRFYDRLARDVEGAFTTGMHPETLAQRFVELDDMALNDARRIARDQIGKLNGQFNQARQESLGLTGYAWRGAMDNRERDEHVAREGTHFEWDDPPEDGHPGEPVQCRCYAEPDFSPLLEAA